MEHLPKPVATDGRTSTTALGPVLCLWPERMLFVGRLGEVSLHRHAAAACVLALGGVVRLQLPPSKEWHVSTSALIPAGRMHALDLGNAPAAVVYNEPHLPFYARLSSQRGADLGELGSEETSVLIESLWKVVDAPPTELKSALLDFDDAGYVLAPHTRPPMVDRRVRQAIALMQDDMIQKWSLVELAQATRLSESRLQHLITKETGVPWRRLRTWLRFRHALSSFSGGASLTVAALDAGFASSTHFSHAFKAMFGVSASSVLLGAPGPRIVTLDG